MEALGYLASLIMGVTIGLLGGGGSILTVPILFYLFSVSPLEATTSSLFIVGSTALITAAQYAFRKQADIKTALIFSLPSLIGIYFARSILLPSIPESVKLPLDFMIDKGSLVLSAFAILMIAASISMIKRKSVFFETKKSSILKVGFQGIGVGFVTGFVGAGGGFLILPALINLLNLPMRIAVGTSLMIIAVNSLFGFSVSILNHSTRIDWTLQFTILFVALVGSFLGAKFSLKIEEKKLKKAFGWFVLVAGCAIFLERLM